MSELAAAVQAVVDTWDCTLPLSYAEQERHGEAVLHLRLVFERIGEDLVEEAVQALEEREAAWNTAGDFDAK